MLMRNQISVMPRVDPRISSENDAEKVVVDNRYTQGAGAVAKSEMVSSF
jgi:hypothetical protein